MFTHKTPPNQQYLSRHHSSEAPALVAGQGPTGRNRPVRGIPYRAFRPSR